MEHPSHSLLVADDCIRGTSILAQQMLPARRPAQEREPCLSYVRIDLQKNGCLWPRNTSSTMIMHLTQKPVKRIVLTWRKNKVEDRESVTGFCSSCCFLLLRTSSFGDRP